MMILEGLRVLELGRVPPAELPGMMLADLGADVLKIDSLREQAPTDDERRFEAHSHTNRNKRSIALNLKAAEGADVLLRLARDADVIIEGFRPGVMARLGVDYARVASINPRIVYCSMSGFGQDGPYRNRPAHDLNFLALSGALSLWGAGDAPPDIPLNLVADYGGAGMHAALAIVLALLGRERGGQGQYIDISYLDTTIALLAVTPNLRRVFSQQQVPSDREGVFCGGYPYYSLYRTADARWLSVACSEPPLWSNFCDAIGLPQLARFARCAEHYQREPNAEEAAARQAVQQVIGAQTCRHWEALFADRNACVAAVRTIDEMLVDPQVAHRGLVDAVDHPQHGRIAQFASPLRLSRTPPRLRSAAPEIGEHTQQVLTSLGFDAAAMSALRERGVIH